MKSKILPIALSLVLPACAANAGSDDESTDISAARGEHVYTQHCATCHGDAGGGAEPWFPSLKRLAAMREPDDMVSTVLTGRFRRAGEINGHTIPIMPAWGQLTNADVAAIINYVQTNWGEDPIRQITAEDVASTREQLWEID